MASSIVRIGNEQQVNTVTTGSQEAPSVTALADGGWVVTWTSMDQDSASGGIYQQRYNADGSTNGVERQVNTVTVDSQHSPSVTALGDGGWIVTWQSRTQDGSGYGIYQQRFGADGVALDGEQRVNDSTSGDQSNPSVTALEDGGWVVTWDSPGDGSGTAVYQKVYNEDGTVQYPSGLVNIFYSELSQRTPSITALKDGGWVVTWASTGQESSSAGYLYGVYQQRYAANGDLIGREQLVNTHTRYSQDAPSVTALADGGWLVTWRSFAQDEDGLAYLGVYQQRFSADGTPFDGEQRVNVQTSLDQDAPSVAGLEDGSWVVTWQSDDQDGSGKGIYQRLYSVVAAFGDGLERGLGSGDNEVFQVHNGGLGAGDSLEAGGGIDILKMIESGMLDLTAPDELINVEVVQGSSGNDIIVSDVERLGSVAAIQGGAGTDELRLKAGNYDLSGRPIGGIEAVTLQGTGSITFADKTTALLAHSQTKNGHVILQGTSLTLAERTQLYNQGIRKVTDASGIHTLAPAEASLSQSPVQENAAAGQGIGLLSAIDPNPGDGLRFELIDSAGGRFGLSGHQIVAANGAELDYESAIAHRIVVRVIDDGGISVDKAFTIIVSDVPVETIKGSSRADMVAGGAGRDVLYGGLGKDTLTGGDGQDAFVFDTKPNKKSNMDHITDFSVKDDSIWLDNKIFTKLGKAGSIAKPAALKKGSFATDKAKDKDDYLIYSKKTGVLSYDVDGSGSKAAVEIAQLKKGLGLKDTDFFVI